MGRLPKEICPDSAESKAGLARVSKQRATSQSKGIDLGRGYSSVGI